MSTKGTRLFSVKRYGQFCAVARALDLVGDRWTLLIVRELLLRHSRFTDLLDGLPGIPRNLLAERLRALVGDGLIEKDGGFYALTERGLELRPAIRALAVFGATELMTGPDGDAVRGRWIATAVDARFAGDPEVTISRADDAEVVLDVHGDELRGRPEDVMRRLAQDAVDGVETGGGPDGHEPGRSRAQRDDPLESGGRGTGPARPRPAHGSAHGRWRRPADR